MRGLNELVTVARHRTNVTRHKCQLLVKIGPLMSGHQMMIWIELFWGRPRTRSKRGSPDARWQRVPVTRRCHWKGSVADRGPVGWRHSKCRRAGWSKTTTSINFSGQVKWVGEVRRRLVMEAAMDQNTQPEFDSLQNFKPVELTEKWSCVFRSAWRVH